MIYMLDLVVVSKFFEIVGTLCLGYTFFKASWVHMRFRKFLRNRDDCSSETQLDNLKVRLIAEVEKRKHDFGLFEIVVGTVGFMFLLSGYSIELLGRFS
jgi:hypothetical protein